MKFTLSLLLNLLFYFVVYAQPSYTLSTDKITPGKILTISGKGYPANTNILLSFTKSATIQDYSIKVANTTDYGTALLVFMYSNRNTTNEYDDFEIPITTDSKGGFIEYLKVYPYWRFFEKDKSTRSLYCQIRISDQYAPIVKPIEFQKTPWIIAHAVAVPLRSERHLSSTVWAGLSVKATETFWAYTSFDSEDPQLYGVSGLNRATIELEKPFSRHIITGGPGTEYPTGTQTLAVLDKVTRQTGAVSLTVVGEPKAVVRPVRPSIRPGDPLLVTCYNLSPGDLSIPGTRVRFLFAGPSQLLGYETGQQNGINEINTDGTSSILIGTATQQDGFRDIGRFIPQFPGDKMKPGSYTVTATDVASSKSVSATFTVSDTAPASGEGPTAGFSTSGNVAGKPTVFTDQSKGTGSSAWWRWEWDFDDGNVSTGQSPTHVYQKPGKYYITQKVSNPGFAKAYSTQTITIIEGVFTPPVELPTPGPPTVPSVCNTSSQYTLRSGNWNDPAVWSCGSLPGASTAVQINNGHIIVIPGNTVAEAQTVTLQGRLKYQPNSKLRIGQ